jgi:peptidoglycan/xylan/chitin deacetylase (PgdA/CDA1 family)
LRVALTFDDGPDPRATPAILDLLETAGVPATFFLVGRRAERLRDIVARTLDSGMGVGIHGWDHSPLRGLDGAAVTEQLTRTLSVLWSFDADPKLFRPPFGHWDDVVLDVAARLGLVTVLWDVSPHDWDPANPAATIVDSVTAATPPGSVVLFHDVGANWRETVAALPAILDHLQASGYSFVELGQALVPD